MPIPSLITDLSQTASSNYPQGTDSPSTLDDVQRAHASFIAELRDGKGLSNPVTLASAATTDIGAQNSIAVEITGTNAITSFGANYNGPRFLRFTGILTLTHNAATLNLPGAVNITTAVGDTAIAIPNSAVNGWNVIHYEQYTNAPGAVNSATSAAIQKQTYTSFTTGGTSTAYTLTPAPAITANTAGIEFEITFNSAAGATPTLSVSGLTALPLKYRDGTGALQAITATQVPSGWVSKVYTDGTNWVVLNPYTQIAAVTATFKSLKLVASGLTNTNVVITADEVALKDSSNNKYTAASANITVNSTASGANGLDTGVLAGSTWYSVWVIYNPATATLAGLLSASSTAPTLPAGYTLSARVGWVRTDGTVNKYLLQTLQLGRRAQYVVLTSSNVPNSPLMASGVQGTYSATAPTWAAISVSNFVPSTASRIYGRVDSGYNGAGVSAYMLAPNNAYSGSSTTNPCPIYFNAGSTAAYGVAFDFELESTNIYAAAGAGFGLGCLGWEDNI